MPLPVWPTLAGFNAIFTWLTEGILMDQADKIYREALAHGLSERIAAYMAEQYFADPEERQEWRMKQRGEHERMAQHA